jgi:hypothetical protein
MGLMEKGHLRSLSRRTARASWVGLCFFGFTLNLWYAALHSSTLGCLLTAAVSGTSRTRSLIDSSLSFAMEDAVSIVK